MAWTLNPYAGVEIYDPTDGARIGMHQLMVAINQREAAIGETETEWLMPDGTTEMAQPFLTDLIGAEVKTSSTIKENCTRIRAAILALVDAVHGLANNKRVFVVSSESDTYWTISTLQAAIGHVYVASIGPQDALFLQNSLDILNRLIYVRIEIVPTNRSVTRYYNTAPASQTTWNGAWSTMVSESLGDPGGFSGWDARYASPATGPSASAQHLGSYGGAQSFPGDKFSTCLLDGGACDFDLSPYSGALTLANFNYLISESSNWNSGAFDVVFGGITLPATGPTDVSSILSLGAANTTSFVWDSVPGTITPIDEWVNMFRMGAIFVYIELAGILADQ